MNAMILLAQGAMNMADSLATARLLEAEGYRVAYSKCRRRKIFNQSKIYSGYFLSSRGAG